MSDEDLLRPSEREMKPYPPKTIMLANGEILLIRQVVREDVPALLNIVRPAISIEKDYYDSVGVRLYAELLGWYRYRVRDEYCLVGQINGEVVGMVNGRLYDEKIGVSYHTMAFKRGLRVGAHLFAAKMEYHFEQLENEKVLIVAESPIGFKRWMEELRLEATEPVIYHELGGVDSWVLTKENYEDHVKPNKVFGTRPVLDYVLNGAKNLIIPSPDVVHHNITGE